MTKQERQFIATVWQHYKTAGRHDLPWRQTYDPYQILVSELMLQQTQASRVITKYEAFIAQWPTVQQLAAASLADVLKAWQGLGYNRRAKFLHQCAQVITAEQAGSFPTTRAQLETLPGIGPYTAGAILAFAFNQPVVLIETNVRRVFLHHFFPAKEQVTDTQLYPYIERTVSSKQAREWYAALMDYGAYLKRAVPNPNRRSRHYSKQSAFVGSDREIRGAIIRLLSKEAVRVIQLKHRLDQFAEKRVAAQVQALRKEGMIEIENNMYILKN